MIYICRACDAQVCRVVVSDRLASVGFVVAIDAPAYRVAVKDLKP